MLKLAKKLADIKEAREKEEQLRLEEQRREEEKFAKERYNRDYKHSKKYYFVKELFKLNIDNATFSKDEAGAVKIAWLVNKQETVCHCVLAIIDLGYFHIEGLYTTVFNKHVGYVSKLYRSDSELYNLYLELDDSSIDVEFDSEYPIILNDSKAGIRKENYKVLTMSDISEFSDPLLRFNNLNITSLIKFMSDRTKKVSKANIAKLENLFDDEEDEDDLELIVEGLESLSQNKYAYNNYNNVLFIFNSKSILSLDLADYLEYFDGAVTDNIDEYKYNDSCDSYIFKDLFVNQDDYYFTSARRVANYLINEEIPVVDYNHFDVEDFSSLFRDLKNGLRYSCMAISHNLRYDFANDEVRCFIRECNKDSGYHELIVKDSYEQLYLKYLIYGFMRLSKTSTYRLNVSFNKEVDTDKIKLANLNKLMKDFAKDGVIVDILIDSPSDFLHRFLEEKDAFSLFLIKYLNIEDEINLENYNPLNHFKA